MLQITSQSIATLGALEMSVTLENHLVGDGDLSLAEQAYRHLRDRLIMLDIRPGEAINDGKIAADLGIGRTPVREALKRLESDHLVVSYPRRGTFATVVDITELADVSELRESLEPLAARRAAKLATPALRAEIRETAAAISTMGRSEEHTSELQSHVNLVCRLLLEKKK